MLILDFKESVFNYFNLGRKDSSVVTLVPPTSVDLGLYPKFVCGLIFIRSQSYSKGFSLGTLVFLPQENRLPAYSIWLWCCASRSSMGRVQGSPPSQLHSSFGPHMSNIHELSLVVNNAVDDPTHRMSGRVV